MYDVFFVLQPFFTARETRHAAHEAPPTYQRTRARTDSYAPNAHKVARRDTPVRPPPPQCLPCYWTTMLLNTMCPKVLTV